MYKLYICAAIFIFLSAFKYFAPEHGEQLRQQVISIIDADKDYPQMVETIGRRLSETGLREEIIKVFYSAQEDEMKQAFSRDEPENRE